MDNYFKPAFARYVQQTGPKPSAEVIIAFGQKFSNARESLSNLLVCAYVTHTEAFNLLTRVGVTSLHSDVIICKNTVCTFKLMTKGIRLLRLHLLSLASPIKTRWEEKVKLTKNKNVFGQAANCQVKANNKDRVMSTCIFLLSSWRNDTLQKKSINTFVIYFIIFFVAFLPVNMLQ